MWQKILEFLLKLDATGFFKFIVEGSDKKRVRVLSVFIFVFQSIIIGLMIYYFFWMTVQHKGEIKEINKEAAQLRKEEQLQCDKEKLEIENRAAMWRTMIFKDVEQLRNDYRELAKRK